MRESTLLRKIVRAVKQAYPSAIVWKIADRFTRGVPDLLILFGEGKLLFVEVKRPGGKVSPIQEATSRRLQAWGGGTAIVVVESVESVLSSLKFLGAK